jgi:hypothetical protein
MKVKTNLKAGWCKWPFEKCDPNQRGGDCCGTQLCVTGIHHPNEGRCVPY